MFAEITPELPKLSVVALTVQFLITVAVAVVDVLAVLPPVGHAVAVLLPYWTKGLAVNVDEYELGMAACWEPRNLANTVTLPLVFWGTSS